MDTSGLASLAVAFVLSSLIGFERELRQKGAGLRTHTLVGVGAALFTLAGRYGFGGEDVGIDPTRIAAQVVTGIGFIGAGRRARTHDGGIDLADGCGRLGGGGGALDARGRRHGDPRVRRVRVHTPRSTIADVAVLADLVPRQLPRR